MIRRKAWCGVGMLANLCGCHMCLADTAVTEIGDLQHQVATASIEVRQQLVQWRLNQLVNQSINHQS